MDKITQQMPESCRGAWEAMINFDFMKAYGNVTTSTVKELRGHRLQPTFPADVIEYAYDHWTPRGGDVLVASFPRTGTNWTTEIVRNILYCRDDETMALCKSLPIQLAFFEGGGPDKFEVADHLPIKRRLTTSHLPADLVNVEKYKNANAKIVSVIRNPKDQILSWFNFSKRLPYLQLEPYRGLFHCDWDQFLENCLSGKQPIGMKDGEGYLDHISSWYPHRDNKTVFFVCFEDMKKDLPKEIRRLAKFLEVDLTEEEVMSVAEKCGFSAMLKASQEERTKSDKERGEIGVLHKGNVGNWKNHFTVAQSERVDALVQEKLSNTDIEFTYEL